MDSTHSFVVFRKAGLVPASLWLLPLSLLRERVLAEFASRAQALAA